MCLTFVSMSRGQALPRSITFALIFGLGCIAAAFSSVPSSKRSAAVKKKKKVVLVDMDGVLVDWDAGFRAAWAGRTPIDRSASYAMEKCVPPAHEEAARR